MPQVCDCRAFLQDFKQDDFHFGSPELVISLAHGLRITAQRANAEAARDKAGGVECEEEDDDMDDAGFGQVPTDVAFTLLGQTFFPLCNKAPVEKGSRRWSTLGLVNQILKLVFAIDQIPLCKPYTEQLQFDRPQGRNAVPFENWSKADRVTYCVFRGRKSILKGEYLMADEQLAFALAHCHKDAWKNRRQILIWLIPVRMALGSNPTRELLEKHNLSEYFAPIVQVILLCCCAKSSL